MPFDWTEFLALARELGRYSGPSYSPEAARRTSVSRAYYAAFCYARSYAENRFGFRRTRTGRDHSLLRVKNPGRKSLSIWKIYRSGVASAMMAMRSTTLMRWF